MKKVFIVLIAILIAVTAAMPAIAADPQLKEGEILNIKINYEYSRILFVPKQSGNYEFSSISNLDVFARLYDDGMNYLTSNDDDGEGLNFNFVFDCTAGSVYYLNVKQYNYNNKKTVGIKVVKSCDHKNVTEYPAVLPGCGISGMSAGKFCNDCGKWLMEIHELAPEHVDADGDYICDVCSEVAILSGFSSNNCSYTLYCCGDFVVAGNGYIQNEFYLNVDEISRVKRIIINEGITGIGYECFSDFDEVEKIILPESLEYIGSRVLTGEKLTEIHIPANVRKIVVPTFSCNLEKITVASESKYYKTDSFGALFTYDGKTMVAYPSTAPYESYTIPDGVVVLENSLFANADNLTKVTVPKSTLDIGDDAFNSKILENCETVDTNTYLGDLLIKNNSIESTEPVTIREGTRIICGDAFYSFPNATVDFPDSLEGISSGAFSEYDSSYADASIVLPKNLKHIGDWAMLAAKNVVIPASVEHIGEAALCVEYASVDEGNSYYCSDSTGVIYNKDKTELVSYPSLLKKSSYTVASSVTKLGNYAFKNSYLYHVELPNGLVSIGDDAFIGCDMMKYIEIPETVISVGSNAFKNSSIKSIVIPQSVKRIEAGALHDMESVAILNPDCIIDSICEFALIVGYNGSTAQAFAESRRYTSFHSLDEGHTHALFPHVTALPTCDESGTLTFTCPCGNSESMSGELPPLNHPNCSEEKHGNETIRTCNDCGKTETVLIFPYESKFDKRHDVSVVGWFYTIVYNFCVKLWELFCKFSNVFN